MNEILKFNIVKHDKIWGNEQWIVSAHQNGQSIIEGSMYDGMSLAQLYIEQKELFGNHNDTEFPLLVKIIEADDHLSVQVHPDDEYAKKYENSLGKNECWYVLAAKDEADIVVGHTLSNRNQLKQLIETNKLEQNLDILPIKAGDFFNVPAGTIHAIRGGTTILEVQQSSDVTYRLYDYGRLENGKPRELHIEKSLDVVDYHKYQNSTSKVDKNENRIINSLVDNKFFTVEKIIATNDFTYQNDYNFIIGVALSDKAYVNGQKINKNQGFVAPANVNLDISENSEIYISYIR